MADLRELYQEMILDHNKRPRNFRVLEAANRKADGFNPLCGDKITIYARVEDGVVKEVAFQGSGCAISTASASMMTEALKGMSEAQAKDVFTRFHTLVTQGCPAITADLGKLAVFAGVFDYPARVKCATLCWHTLQAALAGAIKDAPVTTE